MHRPGYVQGGQEANRGYLLLGVHHRRIHSDTLSVFCSVHGESVLEYIPGVKAAEAIP